MPTDMGGSSMVEQRAVNSLVAGSSPALPASGHNNPPSQIDFTRETFVYLADWLKENPVIETEESAREGKLLADRASTCLRDLNAERDARVRPLNIKVKEINGLYRMPRASLERVAGELLSRLAVFAKAEEERRIQVAQEAHRAAEEAFERARAAQKAQGEVSEDAAMGVVTDAGSAITEALEAEQAYEKAQRAAWRAEREIKVRIGGGFQKALSLHDRETLFVADAIAAINEMGITERITEAILIEAREYRRITGGLPAGITATHERSL